MTASESNKLLTTAAIISSATTKVHSFVRQTPVTSTSFQASRGDASGKCDQPNGRVSVQPTSFEGGLLVGLYDPHLGPQCAEYLQQHLIPILDESLSTQLDNSDDDNTQQRQKTQNASRIDPKQVADTLKSTFLELDELLLATAITVALTQLEDTKLTSEGEIKKAQEVVAQVVTGSTALVGFLVPQITPSSTVTSSASSTDSTEPTVDQLKLHDFYLAQLGDSVAIVAGLDAQGQWTARRLNPPETHEHSVRYPGSGEYRRVVSEAKERALTVEQYLTQHNGHHKSQRENSPETATTTSAQESFLTRGGKFLGLPVTRAFGDLDWKIEQEVRYSVANWVEESLRTKIDETLGGGHDQTASTTTTTTRQQQQDEVEINNLNDPPYVAADPAISKFVLETRKHLSGNADDGPSDQLLIFLNRGLLYSAAAAASTQETTNSSGTTGIKNPYDQALISDFELSRVVADTLEQGEDNCALAMAKALDQARKEIGEKQEGEELEGSIVVIAL
ncbi:hypothetical protein BG011_002326 [Mortierella polycephala]|uniref:PPM-type phosphatase domain-containing protein n=1 Tax=Mortierella polycephala TaxID=41804 RepID=A0A9P6U4W6_9FUNG|nr:hypothetical protein BG011_002326 [Mortierella polycephala]